MNPAQREMDATIEVWLDSYRRPERYLAATESLFELFAKSWQGSRRYLTEAFADFREALLKEHGLEHRAFSPAPPKQQRSVRE